MVLNKFNAGDPGSGPCGGNRGISTAATVLPIGPLRTIYDFLPDASTNTVTNLFGAANPAIRADLRRGPAASCLGGPRSLRRGLLRVPRLRDPGGETSSYGVTVMAR
jgi:hypothetical protein